MNLRNEMLGKILNNNAKVVNMFMSQGNIGRGFSFTKKGPGRTHNNVCTDRRFSDIQNIFYEYDLRVKYGRVSNSFIKRWNKEFRPIRYRSDTNEFILRKLCGKYKAVLRKK